MTTFDTAVADRLFKTWNIDSQCRTRNMGNQPLNILPNTYGIGWAAMGITFDERYSTTAPRFICLVSSKHFYNVRDDDSFSLYQDNRAKGRTFADGLSILPYVKEEAHLHSSTYQLVWFVVKRGIVGFEIFPSFNAALMSARVGGYFNA